MSAGMDTFINKSDEIELIHGEFGMIADVARKIGKKEKWTIGRGTRMNDKVGDPVDYFDEKDADHLVRAVDEILAYRARTTVQQRWRADGNFLRMSNDELKKLSAFLKKGAFYRGFGIKRERLPEVSWIQKPKNEL